MNQQDMAFFMDHVARAAERTAEEGGGLREFAADLQEMVLALRCAPIEPPVDHCATTDMDECLYHPLGGPDCVVT
jgi:hypothetical protein